MIEIKNTNIDMPIYEFPIFEQWCLFKPLYQLKQLSYDIFTTNILNPVIESQLYPFIKESTTLNYFDWVKDNTGMPKEVFNIVQKFRSNKDKQDFDWHQIKVAHTHAKFLALVTATSISVLISNIASSYYDYVLNKIGIHKHIPQNSEEFHNFLVEHRQLIDIFMNNYENELYMAKQVFDFSMNLKNEAINLYLLAEKSWRELDIDW